jgi:hypothetical protein
MVLGVPTVAAVIITVALIAVPIALIVPIATRGVVTAVTSVRAENTGRHSKDTCDYDVASHTIEGIHRQSPRGQRSA